MDIKQLSIHLSDYLYRYMSIYLSSVCLLIYVVCTYVMIIYLHVHIYTFNSPYTSLSIPFQSITT